MSGSEVNNNTNTPDGTGEERVFSTSPNNDTAARQLNKGLSGEGGALSGVDGVETPKTQLDAKEKKERERMVLAMTSEQIAQAYAEMSEAISNMQSQIDKMDEGFSLLCERANEILSNLDENISEAANTLSRQKAELAALEEGLDSASDKEYQTVLIDLKKAEIENTESVQKLYTELRESTAESLNDATQEFNNAKTVLSQLQEMKLEAEGSDNPAEKIELLNQQIAAAEQNVQVAQSAITDIENRAELAGKIITFGASELQIESASCSAINDELKKLEMTKARTELTQNLTSAIKDGVISQTEAASLMALSDKAGVTQENQMQFAKDIAKSGIAIETPSGALTGAAAETYLLSEFDKLRQEKTEELDNVHKHISNTAAQATATQTEITAQEQILGETTATIDKITTEGSEIDIAAAKLGIYTIGENQSYATSIITDINGNEVHIDNSGDQDTYYHLDATGTRVDYDPIVDADQLFNFSMGKDGGAAMMSSDQPSTVKRFANIELDSAAGLVRYSQMSATTAIDAGELTLGTLANNIAELKQHASTLQSDIDTINKVEQQLALGEISIEEANIQIVAIDNNSKLAASETLNISQPHNDPNGIYANGLTMGSILDEYTEHNEINASYTTPISDQTAGLPSLTSNIFGKNPLVEQPVPSTEEHLEIKDNPKHTTPNTGMIG